MASECRQEWQSLRFVPACGGEALIHARQACISRWNVAGSASAAGASRIVSIPLMIRAPASRLVERQSPAKAPPSSSQMRASPKPLCWPKVMARATGRPHITLAKVDRSSRRRSVSALALGTPQRDACVSRAGERNPVEMGPQHGQRAMACAAPVPSERCRNFVPAARAPHGAGREAGAGRRAGPIVSMRPDHRRHCGAPASSSLGSSVSMHPG